jgi:hypothetical protein
MSDSEFFDLQWRKLLTCLLVASPQVLAAYGAMAWRKDPTVFTVAAVLAATALQAGVIIASALMLRLLYHRWWKAGWWTWAVLLGGVGILLFGKKLQETGYLEWLLPTGWVAGAFHHSVLEGRALGWILAVLAGALTLAILWLLARVRSQYGLTEVPLAGAGVADSALAQEMAREAAAWAGGARPTAEDRAAARASFDSRMEDVVRSREFLAPLDWTPVGWVERNAAAVMTQRERLVAEFLTAGDPGWSRSWKRAVLLACIGLAATAVLRNVPGSGFAVALTAIALASGLGVPGFCWPGFRLSSYGVIGAPFFGPLPLGVGEMIAVIAKVHVVRCAAMVIPAVVIGASVATVSREHPLAGALAGVYLIALSVATAPAAIAFRFMDLSRDGTRRKLHPLFVMPVTVAIVISIPVAVVMPFADRSGAGWAISLGTVFLASWLVAGVVHLLFRWSRRDFLRWYQPDSM